MNAQMIEIIKKEVSNVEIYADPKNVPAAKNNSKHTVKINENGYLKIVSNTSIHRLKYLL